MKSAENETEPTAMRACAAMLAAEGYTNAADYFRRKADELDPPEPDIPDGFVWFRLYDGEWQRGIMCLDEIVNQYAGKYMIHEIEDIRPLRTLETGQVAVYQEVLMNAEYLLKYGGSFARSIAAQLRDALNRDTETER